MMMTMIVMMMARGNGRADGWLAMMCNGGFSKGVEAGQLHTGDGA